MIKVRHNYPLSIDEVRIFGLCEARSLQGGWSCWERACCCL